MSERSQDFDRFLTFIDAIVAIAVTLLVLPLVEVTRELDHYSSVGSLLRHNIDSIWAFVLSFVIISRYWMAQHRAVQHVLAPHPWVTTVMLAWSMTIVFLPFPTALVAEDGETPEVKVLYVGTLICTSLALACLVWMVQRHPEITDGRELGDPVDGVVVTTVQVVALAIMLAVPATSYFPMLLLILADNIADGWRRIRGRPPRHHAVGD